MNKELEALKEARNHRHEKDKNLVVIDIDYFNKCLDGIETAFKRLEEHDKIFKYYDIESSTELEQRLESYEDLVGDLSIETEINKENQKKLKAYEIIIDKDVDIA